MSKKIAKDQLIADIQGQNSSKRQKAFKYIRKNNTQKLSKEVFDWLQEADQKCTGATKSQYWDLYEACMTLGALGYKKALSYLEQKGRTPGAKDNLAAGMMFLKLSKQNQADFSQVFSFLEAHYDSLNKGIHSTMEMAAYATVGNEKMIPSITHQKIYLSFATRYLDEFNHHPTIGLIASSLAGFKKDLKLPVLSRIKRIGEKEKSYISNYAEDALLGKYNTYNPRA